MKTIHYPALAALLAGCAAGPSVGRAPQVPPLAIDVPQADLSRERVERADADRRAPPPVTESPAAPRSADVAYRTFTQIVEVPVEVERPYTVAEPAPGATYGYHYASGHDYDRRWRRGHWFPVHTLVGAGIGAAIGRHHGHSRRGAWIGAHTGLLFDVARWWR